MQQQVAGEEPIKVEFDNFEHGFPEGFGPGAWGHLAYAIGLAFAVFQLYVAAFNYLPSQVVRGVHVGFLILLTFGLIGNFTAKTGVRPRHELDRSAPPASSAASTSGSSMPT